MDRLSGSPMVSELTDGLDLLRQHELLSTQHLYFSIREMRSVHTDSPCQCTWLSQHQERVPGRSRPLIYQAEMEVREKK